MKINYSKILKKNMKNVLIEILKHIEKHGLNEGHHLYLTFKTTNNDLPKWLKQKFKEQMTIVIQYEYWNLKVNKNNFNITLSFNDAKVDLNISFDTIISFADPYANFGLKLINEENSKIEKNNKLKNKPDDNILIFNKYKKN